MSTVVELPPAPESRLELEQAYEETTGDSGLRQVAEAPVGEREVVQ